MKNFRFTQLLSIAVFLGLGGMMDSARAAAGDVSVHAELSRSEVNVGEMAELQVQVTGADVVDVPQEIRAEGLQIRLSGQSKQVQMVMQNGNTHLSSTVVYSYSVTPLQEGKFTIPSIPVRTNVGLLRTSELPFAVLDAGSGNANAGAGGAASPQSPLPLSPGMPGFSQRPQRPVSSRSSADQLAFGEISCPKKSIYAGEMVPVEIRYYFDAHYPVQVRGKVDFGSEGILVERFPDPKESREERNGLTYNVLTFHTLLSAVKPGSIDAPPAKLDSQIQMPGALPPGFDDPVFQRMMGGRNPFSETRELVVKTPPLHLDILPLPKEGRPASFAGAVGQFDMDALVANPKPAPGDPVTLTVKIAGKGNFTGMGVPVLTESEGWRTYPPVEKVEKSDELSLSGVKSFEFTLIAQEVHHRSPGVEFSYFDPVAVKYVTLTTKPLPLEAAPGSSSGSPVFSPNPSPTPGAAAPSPAPTLQAKEDGAISTHTLRSWKTPFQRSEFLIATLAMCVATAALAGLLYFRRIQVRGTSAAQRRRRASELRATLESGTLAAADAYDVALEYATLGGTTDSEVRSSVITALTERRDVLKYGFGGSMALSAAEREKLLETLLKLSSKTSR